MLDVYGGGWSCRVAACREKCSSQAPDKPVIDVGKCSACLSGYERVLTGVKRLKYIL